MTKLLLGALIAIPLLGFPSLTSDVHAKPTKKRVAKAKVYWRASFSAALAEAKRTGKPIFVDFYTTWCGPCKYLDAVTFQDARFVAESKKWVMVKVDAEKNAANEKLAAKYKIDGYPALIFLQPGGKEADRAMGLQPTEMLVSQMKKAVLKATGGKSI